MVRHTRSSSTVAILALSTSWMAACGSDPGANADGAAGRSDAAVFDGGIAATDGGRRPTPIPTEPVTCAAGLSIPIHAEEYAGVPRLGSPVSGGIPLPRGEVADAELASLVLVNGEGLRMPSFQQPIALGHWGDGSVKWLLLDFTSDLEAGGTQQYTLCRAESTLAPSTGIAITESDDGFTVDTGVLQVTLSKTRFSFVDEAWVDSDGDGTYADDERVVDAPGEMFVDLDDSPPGDRDTGVYEHPDESTFGMEGGNWLRDSRSDTATRYIASAGDYELSLFRRGTTHTIFKMEGWHRSTTGDRQFAKYTLYLHFHAGQSFVRASHTFIMTGDPKRNFIRRMGIELPFAAADGRLRYAFGGPFETAGEPVSFNSSEPAYVPITTGPSEVHAGEIDASGSVSITSIGPDKYYHNVPLDRDLRVEYRVRENGVETHSGYAPSGWGDISSGAVGLAAGVRDFWREHPKEVGYDDGRLTAYIWPDEGGKTLDLRRRFDEARGPASELGRAARREFAPTGSAVGIAKTTDLFFYFHPGSYDDAQVDVVFRDFEEPIRPFVSGQWNMATGVFGPVHPYDMERFPQTENFLDLTYAWMWRSAEEFSWYGMLDYGDHLLEYESLNWELPLPANTGLWANWGYSGWMQESYRMGAWMMVQYMRSGRQRYFRQADTWLRHHRDVDCVHWDTPDDGARPGDNNGGNRLGGGHRHDQQHWGGYMAGYGIPTIATAHHYYLTGDGRDLDVMRIYSDWILNHARIENHGRYSVLYMGEALGDASLIEQAWAADVRPAVGFGRSVYDSGMGLLLYDIQTNGEERVRERLRSWAEQDGDEFAFLRAHIEAEEGGGVYTDAIRRDFESLFPDNSVRTRYFAWAPREPAGFHDAFSPDIMPDGPWGWPVRSIEHLMFDGPGGMGNNPSRNVFVSQLPWLMDAMGEEP